MTQKSLVSTRLFCYIIYMLNIIYTNTTIQGHKSLYRLLSQNIKGKHIFIVPDRFTLGVEKEICEYCFPSGSFNVNVYSVTRLATKIMNNERCLSKEGTVVLLNRIIRENTDSLVYYKSIKSYQFSKQMFAAIAALRSSNLTAEQIKNLPLFEGATKDKLSDIALIYEKYTEALSQKYTDTITRIEYLINSVQEKEEIYTSNIYLLGFNIYSGQQIRLIKELLLYCPTVNISVTKENFGTNKEYFPDRQIEDIIAFCTDKGIAVKAEEEYALIKQPFEHLHKNLFGFAQTTFEGAENVRIFEENNPYEEIKAVAKEINYLVKSKGYRYKDISLVCNNEEYLPILSEVFERCDVPCFLEKKYYIKDSLLLKYIFRLYSCVVNGYQRADIIKLLHHPFANIDKNDIIVFENYIKSYNLEHTYFLKPFSLGEFECAERVRQTLINQISLVPSGAKVGQHCQFLLELTKREDIAKTLEAHAASEEDKLIASSNIENFCLLLAEISDLIGDEDIDVVDFFALLQSATSDMSLSLLPRYIDVVFVGNTTQSRFSEQKILFIVGANRGYFPVQRGDSMIFTAMDAEVMKANNLDIFPSPLESNGFEQFVIIDLVTKAEIIYIGYSLFNIMGEELSVGEGVREIRYLLQLSPQKLINYHNFNEEESLLYNLVNLKNAYYEYMFHRVPTAYRMAVHEFLTANGYNLDCESGAAQKFDLTGIFRRDTAGRYLTSASQLESYFKCPFRHFLSYGLKLREEDSGDLTASTIGIFIHNVLEYYFQTNHKILRSVENYYPLIEKAIIRETAKPEYDGLLNNSMNAYTIKNICNECRRVLAILTENYKKSLFDAKYFEFGFGWEENTLITVDVGDKTFSLRGKIDRVDFYKDSVVIIDYKTGRSSNEYRQMYYGSKIQLCIYLDYFLKQGYKAGGAFYLPIKSGYSKEGKFYTLTGYLIDDTEIYYALDGDAAKDFDDVYESRVLPFSLVNKKGEVSIKKVNGVLSAQDFSVVNDYVATLIKENLQHLLEGDLAKSPLKNECESCSYKNLCGEVQSREYSPKKVSDFYIKEQKC